MDDDESLDHSCSFPLPLFEDVDCLVSDIDQLFWLAESLVTLDGLIKFEFVEGDESQVFSSSWLFAGFEDDDDVEFVVDVKPP